MRDVVAAQSPIVRLHFTSPPRALNGTRRRLALRDGWRVQGNLHTLGYFAADVCLGTPPTSYELIVDTGSSLMALPCAGCSHCGQHRRGARFDVSKSSTSHTYSCSDTPPNMHCHSCTAGECTYSVSYAEGSRISGRMLEDRVVFASEKGGVTVPVAFGCQTYESGLFNSQVADGIVGFAWGSGYGMTLQDRLVEATNSPDIFSMCLAETVGALVLGGSLPKEPLGAPWIPFSSRSSYAVSISAFRARLPQTVAFAPPQSM